MSDARRRAHQRLRKLIDNDTQPASALALAVVTQAYIDDDCRFWCGEWFGYLADMLGLSPDTRAILRRTVF